MQVKFGTATETNYGASEAAVFTNGHWNALAGQPQEFSQATPLFVQGSPSREVFYIERGLVKLVYQSEDGQELIVGLRSKGSFLGAASAIVREPHLITAITVTNCSLRRITTDAFLHLAKSDEQFCWYLHQIHSHEVHQQMGQQVAFRCLSARERFEKLLQQFLSLMRQNEKQFSIKARLPLKHWEIAQLVGVTPEHLSRILKQIKQEGTIQKQMAA
ncbi:MAG: Crp/Fnr family transcriptional regulator [Acidobacteria bacterium]|nr:Crp/Fnr family transcriptional regulator [Acidobacteriota bacterium]